MGSFFKRLEIHPAFQTSCPWDLCETCVSWNALYLLPLWGWHMFCGLSSWKCYTGLSVTWKCCKFILMRIFTEMPHKFCIYDLLGVIFISSVRSQLICVVNKRCFLFIMLIFQLIIKVVTCEGSLKILKGTWTSVNCFLLEGFPAGTWGSQRFRMQLGRITWIHPAQVSYLSCLSCEQSSCRAWAICHTWVFFFSTLFISCCKVEVGTVSSEAL